MKPAWMVLAAAYAFAQAPPAVTVKQLMLDMIHPAANDILLFVNRGGAKTEGDWAPVRRAALTLAESGNLLTMTGRARDQDQWAKDAKALADAGAAAYQAAQAKNLNALEQLTGTIDASCTTCHKHYRPNVFPRDGGSK